MPFACPLIFSSGGFFTENHSESMFSIYHKRQEDNQQTLSSLNHDSTCKNICVRAMRVIYMIYWPQCEYFCHKLHVKTPFVRLFLYAKHHERPVKFQLPNYPRRDNTNQTECYSFLRENQAQCWEDFIFYI